MKSLTIDQVLKLRLCPEYTRERVEQIYRGRKSMTLLEILDSRSILPEHRVWLMCQPGVLNRAHLHKWQTVVLTRCITDHALHCGVEAVEKWACKWLDGTDRTQDVAWATWTAWSNWAARAAAWPATDAAWADGAAWANWDGGDAWPARAGGKAAEYRQQIRDLRNILRGKP